MSYCTNKSKAIVTFTKNGNRNVFQASDNLPITIECKSLTAQTIKVITSGMLYPTCNSDNTFAYSIERIADNYTVTPNQDHPYNSAHGFSCTFYRVDLYLNSIIIGSINCVQNYRIEYSNTNQQTTKSLTIKNSLGAKIFESQVDNCNYTVACGDQCPVGQERIQTIEYPGYKCREKCPPETCCECDCGDVICCYGSNGQVLKTIPK